MQTRDDYVMVPERETNPENGEQYAPVIVGFALQAKLDGKATAKAGHEVYKDVEFVKILIPGDKLTAFEQPATEAHRKRFPAAYAAFKQRGLQPVHGMPLEQWPAIARSMVLTLRAAHVETVEMLAEISDGHVDRLGYGFRELRQKARAYLAQAKDSAAIQAIAAEKEALQGQIAALQAQINALAGKVPAGVQAEASITPPAALLDKVRTADVKNDVVAAARRPRVRATA